ncbi:MAG: UDP-N-acetylmuramoyl-tripeptide--D-alanyl-D-alanine ligase [Chitinophagales bacterium]|nr:UDP-N-acetylmuramoyl-tripeptide--D-alanyl-D-alanine ligase [Chitinophagales bacterium]MCZ2392938.1 UDP-N-acetylmuramoyl-tripeptide--D-alanyl-D-alanine ligase [Chitinophagales bacterium]
MELEALHQLFLSSIGVSTDTRNIQAGQMFFALKGLNFDGNTYAKKALETGAILSVIDDERYSLDKGTLLVDNVLQTLQDLARYHRRQFNIPVIGITGSNGKTTTKELINAVLKKKFSVISTFGNLNNHIGVPKTLLKINSDTEIAIIEMGANHIHEISELCVIAEPNYGVITSIGRAHIGEFGSFEAIKNTKAELYKWLFEKGGFAFVNQDIDVLKEMSIKTQLKNLISYGSDKHLKYSYQYIDSDPFVRFSFGGHQVQTKLPGEYNFANYITAATIGQFFGVELSDIINALEDYESDNNRSQILKRDNYTLILDAYNANPSSMESALRNLGKMIAPHKGAVLGHMLELGEYSHDEHQQIVDIAENMGLDFLVLVGDEFLKVSSSDNTLKFNTTLDAKEWWSQQNFDNFLILIKGSRGVLLEGILN